MFEHDFIDDRLWTIYREACARDFYSPRCQYFQYELEMDEDQVNPYSNLNIKFRCLRSLQISKISTNNSYDVSSKKIQQKEFIKK
jgi:hypothetical protein